MPSQPDILEVGPRPQGAGFPRWIRRAEVPDVSLPDRAIYECRRTGPIPIDGDVDAKPWPWADLVHIRTGDVVSLRSRVAMMWDDDHLYVAFDFVDPDREPIATAPGTHVYAFDTTAEFFVGGPDGYHEFGVNSTGIGYELRWYAVDPLVERGDTAAIDRLFRIPNFLYFVPQVVEPGKVGDLDYRMPGLSHVERWQERDGSPGWTLEMAMPWHGIRELTGLGSPRPGDDFVVQAMRVHHEPADRAAARGALAGGTGDGRSPTDMWTLSVQGNANVHNVSRWARVRLSDASVS
ncbi:MAG TPA: hypothetical protein VLB67_10555 [Acidimicrobiia bacterium]|nr:hypothetical protein [Acidimicrobiia bacterium]